MENKTNFKFTKVERFKSEWASYKEDFGKKNKYVKAGEDNLFPQHLIRLYNESSIHAACVNATVEAIIGGGLTSDPENLLDKANSHGETWNDIYSKIAYDYKLHGSYALEVIWSMDRSRIAEVYHIDFSFLRAKEKNHRGHIPGWYICESWKQHTQSTHEDVFELPSFNPATKQEEPNQIFVSKSYRPGQLYYPLPDYNAALRVIELDTEIDNFHVNNIKNGLAPSLAITTFMNGSDDDKLAVEQMLRANYGGTSNAGSLMYIDVDSPENAPKIEPIPSNQTDTYYTTINDLTTQKILTAHRITSPMMLGIKEAGQLGGRDEVIDAFLLWGNTVIAPLQQDILKGLEVLLGINYPGIVLGVETKQLYEDGTTEEEIITSVETTDAEDAQINQEIITETPQ